VRFLRSASASSRRRGDGTLKIWDLSAVSAKHRAAAGRAHVSPIYAVALSPDGQSAAAGDEDGVLGIWEFQSAMKSIRRARHTDFIKACAYSPDGGQIVSASADGTLRIWDPENGRVLKVLRGHTDIVSLCAYTPDGHRILSGSEDGSFRLWDATRGTEVAALAGHSGIPTSCAFSPDGHHLVTCSSPLPSNAGPLALLKLWDASTGEELFNLSGHTQTVFGCAFSPDGRRIVSGSYDRTLRIWHAGRGVELASIIGAGTTVCAYSPDGRRILSDGLKTLEVWHASRLFSLPSLCRGHWSAENSAISLGGRWAICPAEGTWESPGTAIKAWDLDTGDQAGEFIVGWKVRATAVSLAGRALAVGDENGGVFILRIEGLDSHPQWTTAVRIYQHDLHRWDRELTALCPWCGSRFAPPANALDAIRGIGRAARLREDQSPCAVLSAESWQEPRLMSECGKCRKPLRFNPFIVDNQDRG
jgi:WD40 repeat protein